MSNSTPSVRTATTDDIPILVRLNTGLFAEDSGVRDQFASARWPGREDYFVELIADGKRNVVWMGLLDEHPVGYLVCRLNDPIDIRPVTSAILESMYVEPGSRGCGVGATLVRRFLRWASDHHAGRAAVNAYTENDRAIRFYRHLGFRPKTVTLDQALSPTKP